ncbi:hypothetical protein Srufu_024700 [Streptomyces libani subsp. rufus]|nr:hypothetical protein Srufu_024700 [Streptomyces libani subsp. rufus]
MDPNTHRGPEEYGEPGSPAVPPVPAFGGAQSGSAERARVVRLVSGPYLVTVNPVDGSEIEPCPPGERPAAPGRLDPEERAAAALAAAPPLPPGIARPETALEERTEDTERLVRLLSRGRSVRVTGPSGSGRTRLLDAVATACADLAPMASSGSPATTAPPPTCCTRCSPPSTGPRSTAPTGPRCCAWSPRSARSSSWTTWNSAAPRSMSCSTRPPNAPS